jgi:P pilus assembly chaperone PapD
LEVRGPEDLENAFRTARNAAEAAIVVTVAGMIDYKAMNGSTKLNLMATAALPVERRRWMTKRQSDGQSTASLLATRLVGHLAPM